MSKASRDDLQPVSRIQNSKHHAEPSNEFQPDPSPSQITRRQFGLGMLGLAAGTRFYRPDKLAPSVIGGVKIGAQSYTFRAFISIDKLIQALQGVGLSYVELWDGHLNPMKTSEAEFKSVKTRFDDAGITVGAYCVNFPVDASDEYLDRGFNGALLLGTSVMTASVQKAIVPRLDQWCQKYKIKLGLHNHWFGDKWFHGDKSKEFESPDDLLTALKGSSDYLSINLDVGHFYAAGYDPVSFFRQNHKRIVSLHLKDRDKDPDRTHRRFGQGATPISEVMKLAHQVRFPYVANIEYEEEMANPSDAVRAAVAYLRQVLS